MVYRGDERFELNADWRVIRNAQRFTRLAQTYSVSLAEMADARGIGIDRAPLSPSILGMLVASKERIWGAVLNASLDGHETATILAHEIGHSWAQVSGGLAHCRAVPRGRDTVEETANVIGALHAVPFNAVARLDLWDGQSFEVARRLGVAPSFVHIRNALGVILGEKSGSRQDAFFALELALLAHDNWVRDVSERLKAGATVGASTG